MQSSDLEVDKICYSLRTILSCFLWQLLNFLVYVYHATFCASKLFFWVMSKFMNSILGDANNIQIGSGTNIQDNSLVHVAKSNLSGKVFPTIIGENVTVGKYTF